MPSKKRNGRPPISAEKIEEVRVCIDQGVSQKDAQEQTGLSLAKVNEMYRYYKPRRGKTA